MNKLILEEIIKKSFEGCFVKEETSFWNEKYLKIHFDSNEFENISSELAILSNPLRIYNTQDINEENFLKDGTLIFVTFDYLKYNWVIINLNSNEFVYPKSLFDINKEENNKISISFRNRKNVSNSWNEIKNEG